MCFFFSSTTNYCFEHSRFSQLEKTKATVGKYKSIDTVETLLNSLSHHVKVEKARTNQAYKLAVLHDEDEEVSVGATSSGAIDPFSKRF
jgi:hypothetical protein